jgi:hypothetical protein
MGNVFVGALCPLAVFFLSFNYKPLPGFGLDHLLARFASAAAVGEQPGEAAGLAALAVLAGDHGGRPLRVSWLVKGGFLGILADPPAPAPAPAPH